MPRYAVLADDAPPATPAEPDSPYDDAEQPAQPEHLGGEQTGERAGLFTATATPAMPAGGPPEGAAARPRRWRCGRRHTLSALCTLGGALGYAQRSALAVTIVRMQALYGWDKEVQGQLLSGFYLGYMLMQVPKVTRRPLFYITGDASS